MIKYFGDKTTAKKLAAQLLMNHIANARGYWTEAAAVDAEAMTEREREQVEAQLKKLADRMARIAGFEESWSN